MKAGLVPLVLGAVLVLSLGVSTNACGGDEEDNANGGALTLEEYFEKAAELKAESEERADAAEASADEDLAAVESVDDAVEVFGNLIDEFVDAAQETYQDLDALDPPSEVEDLHNELVAIFRLGADTLEDFAAELDEDIGLVELKKIGEDIEAEFTSLSTQSEVVCLRLQDIADDNDIDFDLECRDDDG